MIVPNEMAPNSNLMTTTQRSNLITYVIAAASSLFFCSKGVFVKSAYAHGVDAITILALRMAIALPVFAIVAWATSVGAEKLDLITWAKLGGVGFVGYYLSAIVNFSGLQYVSVGLERIVLFTYPSIVLLLGIVFQKSKWSWKILGPLTLAYGGILFAFAGEAYGKSSPADTALGVGLIFTSAVTYAVFILVGADLTRQIGALRFASIVVGFSCVFVITHYMIVHDVRELTTLPPPRLHARLCAGGIRNRHPVVLDGDWTQTRWLREIRNHRNHRTRWHNRAGLVGPG